MKKVLLTGAMGFVGAHMVEGILKNTDWEIVTLDRLDTAGNPNRLADIDCWDSEKHRVRTVFWDLKAEINDQIAKQLDGPFDYILHLAAGSHVDRSITYPREFFDDNLMGTVSLLNYTRNGGIKNYGKFLYFSTDEVYGPAPEEARNVCTGEFEHFKGFKEWDRLYPSNPYSAAKAAAEMACLAYANTYKIPIVITNGMNIFGERQNPEKFIPMVINRVLTGEKIYIHANKEKTQAGKRHYLHARNVCSAALWALQEGAVLDGSAERGKYNIVGEVEIDNLALAQLIEKFVKEFRPDAVGLNYEMVDFHSSRPGHDLRYALDGSLLKSEGFSFSSTFEDSLRKTVEWTLNHPEWL